MERFGTGNNATDSGIGDSGESKGDDRKSFAEHFEENVKWIRMRWVVGVRDGDEETLKQGPPFIHSDKLRKLALVGVDLLQNNP